MPRKNKKTTLSAPPSAPKNDLAEKLKKACEGLWYISETDAEIAPFIGREAAAVNGQNLLEQLGRPSSTPVEEREFSDWVERLTAFQDWFGDEEKATAEKYAALRELLEDNLRGLRVFKLGRIELDVYVVGLDKEGRLAGIRTKAVET
jgi:hypothetical protein